LAYSSFSPLWKHSHVRGFLLFLAKCLIISGFPLSSQNSGHIGSRCPFSPSLFPFASFLRYYMAYLSDPHSFFFSPGVSGDLALFFFFFSSPCEPFFLWEFPPSPLFHKGNQGHLPPFSLSFGRDKSWSFPFPCCNPFFRMDN